jgi:uncharacterized DUF497 family protein
VEFDWDFRKSKANLRKHGVPFRFATAIFLDENRLERLDTSEDYGEDRWITVGLVEEFELTVVYTVRGERIRIISARKAADMSTKRTGTVKFHLDPQKTPRLTPSQTRALRSKRDAEIDTSDIASQAGVRWSRPGALIPAANKQQLTIRLDADVLAFFKQTGRRYQSRINAALREYVNAQKRAG